MLVEAGDIYEVGGDKYLVLSSSSNGIYTGLKIIRQKSERLSYTSFTFNNKEFLVSPQHLETLNLKNATRLAHVEKKMLGNVRAAVEKSFSI